MTTTDKRPAKFRTLAQGMVDGIANKRRDLSQNPTPKRLREYRQRLWEADNLDRQRQALSALADAIDAGTLPPCLDDIKSRKDVEALVYKGTLQGGYYDCIPDPHYRDKSERGLALQTLLESSLSAQAVQERGMIAKRQMVQLLEDKLRFQKIDGFFPTPPETVQKLIDLADIRPAHSILEPSAGIGSIAEGIRARGCNVDCIEIRPFLADILRAKGLEPLNADFLALDIGGKPFYNRILANPPFEGGQDAEHIQRMFDWLAPGGRLVSVCSAGPFFRDDQKSVAFRNWLLEVHAETHDLPDNWCVGPKAFRNTGCKAHVLVINKPL